MPKGLYEVVTNINVWIVKIDVKGKVIECSLGMKHEHPQKDRRVIKLAILSPSVIL